MCIRDRPTTADGRPATNDQRLLATRHSPPATRHSPLAIRHLPPATQRRKQVVALMFVIGLGLTNHLTSVFLLPPAALAVALRLLHDKRSGRRDLTIRPLMRVLPAAVAFAAPLLLYAYLQMCIRDSHKSPNARLLLQIHYLLVLFITMLQAIRSLTMR